MNEIVYAGKHLLTYSVTRHAHENWELIYCTDGSGVFLFDGGDELPYAKGDIVALPPYTPHENHSDEGFTNIHLNMADCSLNFNAPTLVHDDGNEFIFHAFNAAYYHFCGKPQQRAALLSVYGDLIVCYLSAYQNAHPYSKVVEEIENSIIQNYPDCNYELDEYLRSFPFSYDYLRKLFKKELGVTPHKYLIDKRLQTAADSLRSMRVSGSNISEISRQCGFREPLYFSRMFKKKYGVAPSYYIQSGAEALDAETVKISLEGNE